VLPARTDGAEPAVLEPGARRCARVCSALAAVEDVGPARLHTVDGLTKARPTAAARTWLKPGKAPWKSSASTCPRAWNSAPIDPGSVRSTPGSVLRLAPITSCRVPRAATAADPSVHPHRSPPRACLNRPFATGDSTATALTLTHCHPGLPGISGEVTGPVYGSRVEGVWPRQGSWGRVATDGSAGGSTVEVVASGRVASPCSGWIAEVVA
jgi:hypothetical protein